VNQLAKILRTWFGPSAGVCVLEIDGECVVLPEEEILLKGAVPKRCAEFSAGRRCARQALAEIGIPAVPILTGPRLEPVWPAGVAGSITHTASISAAVVCRVGSWNAIGIDLLELAAAGGILETAGNLIASPEEERRARNIIGADPRPMIFSAKESVIKAASARLGRFVDFTEIAVEFDQDSFTAALPGTRLHGWHKTVADFVVTAAVL
jgi:4'-phosphopantetheinyl transferase EntD